MISRRHSGFTLIAALMLLIGLTLIGAAALRTSLFDEKAAGNSSFRGQAFQLAEAALKAGEAASTAINGPPNGSIPGYVPLFGSGASAASWKGPAQWANSVTVPIPNIDAAFYPRYVIEQLNEGLQDGNRSDPNGRVVFRWLRITARAIDPVTGAAIILQTTNRLGVPE